MVSTRTPAGALQKRSFGVGSSRQAIRQTEKLSVRHSRPQLSGSYARLLAGVIETNVVPRLVTSLREPACGQADRLVRNFTDAALADEAAPSLEFACTLLGKGLFLPSLFEDVLAPSAVRLGEMWDRDDCDFLDVARAMDHIHQIVLAHSGACCASGRMLAAPRRILLATLPGERHRLGACLVRAEFWRQGWEVRCHELRRLDELATLVADNGYHAVGISAGQPVDAPALLTAITRMRKASRNRSLIVVAGGQGFSSNPETAFTCGVDATAASAREAFTIVSGLLDGQKTI